MDFQFVHNEKRVFVESLRPNLAFAWPPAAQLGAVLCCVIFSFEHVFVSQLCTKRKTGLGKRSFYFVTATPT